jgi:PKHD-type hydroxylase
MSGGWGLKSDPVDSFCVMPEAFSVAECQLIRGWLDETSTVGKVGDDLVDPTIRVTENRYLYPSEETQWLFRRITDIVNAANAQHFGFDLTDLIEGVQLSRYAAPSGHYGWHVDMTHQNLIRKLSLSLQLSDDDEYDGGDLELSTKQSVIAPRNVGAAILFPSWTSHRVTPVTSGVRYSLVCWVTGPPFR